MMAVILAALLLAITVIPIFRSVPVLGFLPFLLWGALSWATVTPQQYSLIELKPNHDVTLVALNSSAVSLGSVAGTSLGGLALAGGLAAKNLPYAASIFLLCAFAWQMLLIQKQQRKEVLA
jgi:predicted MFS family arabinose efflux permease